MWISIKISPKFVPKGPINNIPSDKLLSEPMMISLLTHICLNRPQWVNSLSMVTCFFSNWSLSGVKIMGSHCYHLKTGYPSLKYMGTLCSNGLQCRVPMRCSSGIRARCYVACRKSLAFLQAQIKTHQSSASLPFVHKGPVTQKTFPLDDVIVTSRLLELNHAHNVSVDGWHKTFIYISMLFKTNQHMKSVVHGKYMVDISIGGLHVLSLYMPHNFWLNINTYL